MKNFSLYICSLPLSKVVKNYLHKEKVSFGFIFVHNSIKCNQQESKVQATLLKTYINNC